jgi:hypothetical protein
MSRDQLIATAERCSALIIGMTFAAAGFLFLISLTDWDPARSTLFSTLPVPGWLHALLIGGAITAFAVCIVTMLLVVTVESHQIAALRESLHRKHRAKSGDLHLRGAVRGETRSDSTATLSGEG